MTHILHIFRFIILFGVTTRIGYVHFNVKKKKKCSSTVVCVYRNCVYRSVSLSGCASVYIHSGEMSGHWPAPRQFCACAFAYKQK